MQALITGGAGFIGTNLAKRLLKDGYEVIIFDNYSTGTRANQIKGCRYLEYDVREDYKNWNENVKNFHLLNYILPIEMSLFCLNL